MQKDVAQFIGVTEDTVFLWETNRGNPYVKHYPKIVEFLGYFPFEIDQSTLAGKIKLYRYQNGLSQEELADKLEINESTVFHYEKGKHVPNKSIMKKLLKVLV